MRTRKPSRGGSSRLRKAMALRALAAAPAAHPAVAPAAAALSGGDAGAGIPGMKKGGRVKKTGLHKLHKGEKVVTAKAAKKEEKKRR
jgi:hypothetical protein